MFNYSRDHNVKDGLDMVATWNSSMLLSEDLQRALVSVQSRQNVVFED
jgi:enoyl-CoA hydratase